MGKDDIAERLFALADDKYKRFSCGLMPAVDEDRVIGVRMPLLRQLAAELHKSGAGESFLSELPHKYHEENLLHGLLLGKIKDPKFFVSELDRFLPRVDNWAVCDSIPTAVLKKDLSLAREQIGIWLEKEHTYTKRFAIRLLMCLFLDEQFDEVYLHMAAIRSDDYYVRMMVAWFFATALAKQRDAAMEYLRQGRLDPWVHNKTIQKAIESFRISPQDKELLRSMKI